MLCVEWVPKSKQHGCDSIQKDKDIQNMDLSSSSNFVGKQHLKNKSKT